MIEKLLKPTKGTITTDLPEPWNEIIVHTLTVKERLESYSLVKKLPHYEDLPDVVKNVEQNRILTWLMIDSPKVSLKEYLEMDDILASVVIGKINEWYGKQLDEFSKNIPFLQKMKETFQTLSTSSMRTQGSTGRKQ